MTSKNRDGQWHIGKDGKKYLQVSDHKFGLIKRSKSPSKESLPKREFVPRTLTRKARR